MIRTGIDNINALKFNHLLINICGFYETETNTFVVQLALSSGLDQ